MLVLIMLLSACEGTPVPITTHPEMPASPGAGMSGVSQSSHEMQSFDQMFITMMVPHHQGAVDMAMLARGRGEHAELKDMAGRMIISQESEIATMKGWQKAWFGSDEAPKMFMAHKEMSGMPKAMDMPKVIAALKVAEPFDLAFLDAMIPHHQGAVTMAQACADQAQHDEMKAFALVIIRDQTAEIEQMRTWRKDWYPTAPTLTAAMGP